MEEVSSRHSNSLSHDDETSVDSSGAGDASKVAAPRDEVKEVQKLAQQETRNVRVWRLIVVAMILATGALVSTFTYRFLHDEEEGNYVDAVSILVHPREGVVQGLSSK
jgi:cobalamin biosynthesis Mg chelatase CobN